MAYTLKTTGLAADATMVLAVDQDGTTLKEFVSSTVDTNKTVPGTVTYGAKSWKGTSRAYFETYANGPFGSDPVTFPDTPSGARPSFPVATGATIFVASAGLRAAGVDQRAFVVDETTGGAYGRSNSTGNKPCLYLNNGERYTATTDSPATDVSFSGGVAVDMDTSGSFFYGLESGSLAADGTFTPSGWTSPALVTQVGGWSGNGSNPGRWHCVAAFDRVLTESEMQSLHDDWFAVLFEAAISLEGSGAANSASSATLIVRAAPAGYGTSNASSIAFLTVQASLSGTGVSHADSQSALSVAAALSGTGDARSAGLGTLNFGAPIFGAGAAGASGHGALTVRAALAGSGQVGAAGVGSFGSGVLLAGTGSALAQGLGALTVRAAPAGSGLGSSTSFATLAVPYRSPDLLGNASPWWIKTRFAAQEASGAQLVGAGRIVAAGIGVLAVRAVLAGAGLAPAVGSAALNVRAALSGAGAASARGLGSLNSGAVLNGTGAAGAAGQAQLATRAALSGAGIAAASGAGFFGSPGAVLAGSGWAGAAAQAALDAQHAALQAIASAQASSTASLRVVAALVGSGLASASGRGAIPSAGGETPVPEYVFKLTTSSRIFKLATVTRINEKAGA